MEKDIGKIQKNDQSDIVIRIDDFGGTRGLTIREFVTSERYTGFTKAGVRIKSEDFPKFKEMIDSITDEDMKDEPLEKVLKEEAPKEEKASTEADTKSESKGEMPDY